MMRDHARADLATPDLLELLSLDDAAFKERFRGTPILRTKRRVYCEMSASPSATSVTPMPPALTRASHDSEPLITEHARWAIEQINNAFN